MVDLAHRRAEPADIDELLRLEQACFEGDRLSRRSFRRWLGNPDCVFLVVPGERGLQAYVLVIRRRGTRLARLYSLAVDPACRGRGHARVLLAAAEEQAAELGSLYLRLEVADDNEAAIALYRSAGYEPFGYYRDYYDDHGDALRMEKCIHQFEPQSGGREIPWLPQRTAFTCGPASLMMAMAGLDDDYQPSPGEEIQIWREATTVFMTSGHGGCHPIGLALSAVRRGFSAEVWLNRQGPLFIDGVRDPNKKRVMGMVHEAFEEEARALGIPLVYRDFEQQQLVDRFGAGDNILVLISTYRLDSKKAPHWVVMSGHDDSCLYVHDPDIEGEQRDFKVVDSPSAMDFHHVPIAREDFAAMSRFGAGRLRTAVLLGRGTGNRG